MRLDRELVAAQDKALTIRFDRLSSSSQSDLDVWEQALHLARTQALGTQVPFHGPRGFLKALGRSTRGPE